MTHDLPDRGSSRELTLRLRQQELALSFANFGLQNDDFQTILDEACRVASEGMGCPLAKVLEFLPEERCFLMRAGIGWRKGSVGHARLGADLESPAGYAFQTGQPVLSNLAGETRFQTPELLVEHGVRRAFNVLIKGPDGHFGVLEADDTDTRDFTSSDTAFLETLAATLSFVVARQKRLTSSRTTEAFLEGVFDSSPDCVKVLSANGILRFINKRGLEMNEFACTADVVGKEFAGLWPEVDRAGIRRAVVEAAAGHACRVSGRCPTATGKERWWDIRFARLEEPSDEIQVISVSRDVTEQREAEEALRRNEELYRSVFASMATGFCVFDVLFDDEDGCVDCRFVEVNDAFEAQTGLRDVVGKTMTQVAPDLDRHWFDVYGEIAKTGEPGRFEYPAAALEGRVFDLYAYRVGEARQRRIAVLFTDISDRDRHERALRQSEARLRELNQDLERQVVERSRERGTTWQVTPHLLGVLDKDGYFTSSNPAWQRLLGWTEAEVASLRFTEFLHPDDLERNEEAFAAIKKGRPALDFENRYRTKRGDYRWLSWVAVPEGDRFYCSARDITTDKERAIALDASRAERESTWRLSQDLLVIAGPDGKLEAVNLAWTTVLGWSEAELVGRSFVELTHPDDLDATMSAFIGILEAPLTAPYEYRMRRKDGAYEWFAWTAAFERGRIYANGRQVTEMRAQEEALRRAEDELRQSQKMEAVGQLTGGLAHDFNNLLTGITGSLDLLQTRIRQGRLNDVNKYVGAAQGAAQRAAALTHRLLAFSRRQTLDPKIIDVARLVEGMHDLVQRTAGPEIKVEIVPGKGLWNALIDPGQLENALLNLCINARDAMPDGGRIAIETANERLDRTASAECGLPEGLYLSVSVSDTGTGMPPHVVAKAFDPFFTTKPLGQGTGLGLSMIYGFARQSGGQVRILSEVGQGTTVILYLPRHIGEAAGTGAESELADAPRAEAGETVLVVDDEPTVRMLVTEVLEDLGYTAIEAADGAAGLRVLQSNVRLDLLVTDVGLPGGLNGRQVADAARVARPDLKVLFITGYADNAVLSEGNLPPGMHVMTKPFAMEALASRIRHLITG